jgi:nucleotide-binding universal stress UspA family protein
MDANGHGTVLAAYDGSPPAQRALVHAAGLVGRGGDLGIVNVIPVQSVSARLETVSESQRARQADVLREARTLLRALGVRGHTIAAAGDPLTEIVAAAAADDARILVVGWSDGKVHRLLHRSLALRLVRAATCDVLIVH